MTQLFIEILFIASLFTNCLVPGYKVKMWYVSMSVGTGDSVFVGDVVGTMTNRAAVSPGMKNHVHVQLQKDGVIVNPTPYIC